MDTRGTVKAHRGRKPSPHISDNYPTQMPVEPIHSDPPSEANSRVTMLQYTQLLQQIQTLAVVVQGLQQSVLHVPLAPFEMRQPPPQPSPIAPAPPEDHPRDECSEPRRPTSLGLIVESSYYHRFLPSIDLGGIDLARKVDDIGRQLEALKVRSSHPFDAKFNVELPFSPHIMNEVTPSKFRMPQAKLYDGTTDPLDHIESFKALILLYGATNGVLCRAFLVTL